jgi:hypothetical protein
MKTLLAHPTVSLSICLALIIKKARVIIFLCLAGLLFIAHAEAQTNDDHLLSRLGKAMVTVGTGVPLVGFAEYSYGFSNRFTMGIVAGISPGGAGYGLRLRGVLHQRHETFRIYAKSPLLFYPKNTRKGIEPWLLAWPTLTGEWKLESGMRLSAGVGAVASSCVDDLFGIEEAHQMHADEPEHVMEENFMRGVWNTVQLGMAIPLNDKMMFQSEVSLALDGLKLAGTRWVGGTPVVVVLGLSHRF